MARVAILYIIIAVFLSMGVRVLAHGEVMLQEGMTYPATQIGGLSSEEQADLSAQAEDYGLTREQIAGLVREDQETEETRSMIKFAVLIFFISGIAYLFYPKKPAAISQDTLPSQSSV